MISLRSQILDKTYDRALKLFGPAGSQSAFFRKVGLGPWSPPNKPLPCLTIVDDGQTRETGSPFDSRDLVLDIKFMMEVEGNWDRKNEWQNWSDNVQQIIHKMHNWIPSGGAVIRMNYISDDPFEVVLSSGQTGSIWVIEFACLYFDEALDLGLES